MDYNGVVTAVAPGNAVISARGEGYEATCSVIISGQELIKGDINGDGVINVTDILRLRAHILGKEKLTGDALIVADMNGDGVINVTDILILRSKILSKP